MANQFSVAGIDLFLCRYPSKQESNLQAWDAADEHMIKTLIEDHQPAVNTLILNDSFGTLSCSLISLDEQWPLVVATDAKTSLLGTQENLRINALPSEHIQWQTSRDDWPSDTQLVLMKLPKNLSYFAFQLDRLSQVLPTGTKVLIGAKAKAINKSLLAIINAHLGPANASLTYKKTRVISCTFDGTPRDIERESRWNVPEYQLSISNMSNVFASNKLDIGARIMLENMPEGDFKSIVDLGCGNGVLGLRAAQIYPNAKIHFVDDSEMATASAKANWHLNKFDDMKSDTCRAEFHWDDCMTHMPEDAAPDLILCNPPFHQGEAITDHIAWQMFLDARRRLQPGGILHVVGNRHLAYHVKLKRLFKNCSTVASNGKFVILQSIK